MQTVHAKCLLRKFPRTADLVLINCISQNQVVTHGDLQSRLGNVVFLLSICGPAPGLHHYRKRVGIQVSARPFKAFSKRGTFDTPNSGPLLKCMFSLAKLEFCVKAQRDVLVLPANFTCKIYEVYRLQFNPDHSN